jgi:hypothetical protein
MAGRGKLFVYIFFSLRKYLVSFGRCPQCDLADEYDCSLFP